MGDKKYGPGTIVYMEDPHFENEMRTETGGTVISTALEEMLKVVRAHYSPADWNIYAAQASDGDNFHDDMPRCLQLLDEEWAYRQRRMAAGSATMSRTLRIR